MSTRRWLTTTCGRSPPRWDASRDAGLRDGFSSRSALSARRRARYHGRAESRETDSRRVEAFVQQGDDHGRLRTAQLLGGPIDGVTDVGGNLHVHQLARTRPAAEISEAQVSAHTNLHLFHSMPQRRRAQCPRGHSTRRRTLENVPLPYCKCGCPCNLARACPATTGAGHTACARFAGGRFPLRHGGCGRNQVQRQDRHCAVGSGSNSAGVISNRAARR